jgi:hypothetical protein
MARATDFNFGGSSAPRPKKSTAFKGGKSQFGGRNGDRIKSGKAKAFQRKGGGS